MTDDQIDKLLLDLSRSAMDYDEFEYGLPVLDHDWVVKARALVREALGPAPAYCGHCAFPLTQCKCKQEKARADILGGMF